MQLALLVFINWIVIYLVGSAIQLLNNWGQYQKLKQNRERVYFTSKS